jgi:hypothetical protein
MNPMTTAGIPVTMKTHCQPLNPSRPSRSSSMPPIGAPTALAIALNSMNEPTILAR